MTLMTVVHNDMHTREHFLHFCTLVRFTFLSVCSFWLSFVQWTMQQQSCI